MTTDLPPFDDGHGREVLFLPGPIREPGVTPGHLDRAVSQKLLNTLQPHAGVEQFGCASMTQAVQGVSFMREPRLLK